MSKKNAVSASNVSAKHRRLGSEFGALQDRRDKLQFQNDLKDHIIELQADPNKLSKARLACALANFPIA